MSQKATTILGSLVSSYRMSYEDARSKSKIGPLLSGIILFKSCVALGIFNYPYAFGKVGYILGTFLTGFVCYLTTYGMYLMADLTNKLESEKHYSFQIYTYHDTVVRCFKTNKTFWKTLSITGIVLVNYSIVVACSVQLGNFFNDIFDTNTIYIKLIMYAVCIVIVLFSLEPEKMKYFAMLATF